MEGLASARAIIYILKAHGVKEAVCSPGSRNAPLLIALAEDTGIDKHVVVDERSAAFMALGIAQVKNRPVALVCTSGTAVLNYAPAVAEAYYRKLPLIVVSADRTREWIDQDDSQTIRQFNALGNFVVKSCDIPAFGDAVPSCAIRDINDAMLAALVPPAGPVHINVQFNNPLPSADAPKEDYRIIHISSGDNLPGKDVIMSLAQRAAGKRILVVCGFMQPDSRFNKAVGSIASIENVAVVCEATSNLHLPKRVFYDDAVLPFLNEEMLANLHPELVIVMGGSLVSKDMKRLLRTCKPEELWTLGYHRTTIDTFSCLTRRIECDETAFLNAFASKLRHIGSRGSYRQTWLDAAATASRLSQPLLQDTHELTEQTVVNAVMRNLPDPGNLIVGNGNVIRNVQIAIRNAPHALFCNRGVSGIDGNLATAVGSASAYSGPTTLLIGDMAMSHDIGALSLRKEMPADFRIIVINNGGGNIFRHVATTCNLPIEDRETYFCVGNDMDLGRLAEAYDMEYMRISDPNSLEKDLKKLFKDVPSRPGITEICVNPQQSAEFFKKLN